MDPQILREAMTAYQAVYDQDLRESIEFENWVNSLVEEGHDLSEYTWEDMYEAYIEEQGRLSGPERRAQQSSLRQQGGALGQRRAAVQASGGPRGQGNNILRKPGDPGRTSQPTTRIQRSVTSTAPTPKVTPPATKSTAPAPKPAPKPAPTAATKPAPTAATKPAPTATPTPRPKDTSITDMIGRSQIRQGAPINTGNKSSDIRSMAARGSLGATPSTSATKPAPARPMGSRKPGSIVSGFDMFDVVKGYLLDEGYADTEEAALAIMANMSEEWKQSIVEMGENVGKEPKTVGKPERPGVPGETYSQRQKRMKSSMVKSS